MTAPTIPAATSPAKKVLLVFAHPEQHSLNGALRDVAIDELKSHGHDVKVSDLYAMGWKSIVDQADFPALGDSERFQPARASKKAFETDSLTADVKAEIEKLRWADFVILQFPMWWFSMPAILKGWIDRVFAYGFAYGVGEHNDTRWGDRYGEGSMAGKRAMLIVTAGGWKDHYTPRGINGPMDDLLFPITHGTLYYPGFEVLPSLIAYDVDRNAAATFEAMADELRQRMRQFESDAPIPYRQQNGGDYIIPSMQLKPGLESPHATGFALHQRDAAETVMARSA